MELHRSKRAIKLPKKYLEDEEGNQADRRTPEAQETFYVYRLLKRKEVTKDLVDQEVFVLWPDDGIWYRAEVRKLRKDMKAIFEYPETQEDEEVDLNQLLEDGEVALKEARPVGHKLCRDEFLVPDDSEEFDESPAQSLPESVEQEPPSPPLEELEEQQYAPEEEEDDIPDAGAIEEEPSEESDASMAAPSDNASSSSDDNALIEEEEALDITVGKEEEDTAETAADKPASLGKRRSTDSGADTLSAQNSSKRPRGGALAEIARKSGWRPTSTPQPPPKVNARPSVPQAAPSSSQHHGISLDQALQQPSYAAFSNRALPSMDGSSSNGRSALHSAEAAAARASQIAAAAMAAGAAAEEAAVDAEDYETASKYAQELLGSLGKPSAAAQGKRFYGTGHSSGPSRLSNAQRPRVAPPKSNPQAVRDKVVANLAASLEKAASELKKEGHSEGLPDATEIARAVEQALQRQFTIDKEYRQKVRSLSFNLSDASNPELRARVLQGEVAPERLVSMTPNELASKELSQWRQQKLQESLRNSVLDEEAAAKFSTAAALAAKEKRKEMAKANYDKGLLTAVDVDKFVQAAPPMQEVPVDLPPVKPSLRHFDSVDSAAVTAPEVYSPTAHTSSSFSPTKKASADTAVKEEIKAEDAGSKAGTTASNSSSVAPAAKSFNWASIKAQASKSSKDADSSDNRFKGFDEFMASAKADAATKPEPEGAPTADVMDEEKLTLPYSPSRNMTCDDEDADLLDLTNLVGASHLAEKKVWQGQLHVPGQFRAQIVADMIGGTGDIGGMLISHEVEVKGRVNIDKLTSFLEDLRMSKNRTVSLGALMCASDASDADKKHVAELVQLFTSKQRTGVLGLEAGLEAYIIPPCPLVGRLLRTAKKSTTMADHDASFIPAALDSSQFLLAVIHRKNWKPSQPRQVIPPQPPAEPRNSPTPDAPSITEQPDMPSASQQPLQDLPMSAPPSQASAAPGQGTTPDMPSAPRAEPTASMVNPAGAGQFASFAPGPEPMPFGSVAGPPSMPQTGHQHPSAPVLPATVSGGAMQQLQNALSSQTAQGPVLPAGLDLGSISALAAALGVQNVAMPGGQQSAPATSMVPAPVPAQLPHQPPHDYIQGDQGHMPMHQQPGAPMWAPQPGQPPTPVTLRPPEGYAPGYPPAGHQGPPEYPPDMHSHPRHQQPGQGQPPVGYGGPHTGSQSHQPYAGEPRAAMPLPRPVTLQNPGGYPPQQAPSYPPHPVHSAAPGPRPQGPYNGPSQAPSAVPAHRRQGLVGWEGLDTVIRGGRRGGREGGGRGRGPGRGENRGRHSGGRGRYDEEGPQEFDRKSSSGEGRGRGRQGPEGYPPGPSRGGRAGNFGRGSDERHDNRGRGGRDRGRGPARGRWN